MSLRQHHPATNAIFDVHKGCAKSSLRSASRKEAQSHRKPQKPRQLPTVAVKSLDQTDTASWREKDDTACIARQQAVTQTRLQQLFTTQYDQEIMAVLFPALLAILLDPVMILVDTGVQSLLLFFT